MMKFPVALIMILGGFASHALAQNQPGQSQTTDKPALHIIIDTVTWYASPYGKNIVTAIYPGGTKSFISFLATHMQLPANLTVSDTKFGKVIDSLSTNFEIGKDGTVLGVNLTKPHTGIYADLIRVIKQSVWTPFIVDNKPASGGYSMRIYFIEK